MDLPRPPLEISSTANPRIKRLVKLRQKSHRDNEHVTVIEGYRENRRAIDNGHPPTELYFCSDLFQDPGSEKLLADAAAQGASLFACHAPVFRKAAYREGPDGLLSVAPAVGIPLNALTLSETPFLVVAQAIEKPGNLGTILRSADGAGADAVIVCDRCTDINNPNVVRASMGTLFSVPVVETSTEELLPWLHRHGIQTLAATPHATRTYSEVDLTGPVAVVVGTENEGLTNRWMDEASLAVRIPMQGKADSLNVATATTILLYEVLRQRLLSTSRR
jgi:TrmH family RNA methyltransferase